MSFFFFQNVFSKFLHAPTCIPSVFSFIFLSYNIEWLRFIFPSSYGQNHQSLWRTFFISPLCSNSQNKVFLAKSRPVTQSPRHRRDLPRAYPMTTNPLLAFFPSLPRSPRKLHVLILVAFLSLI